MRSREVLNRYATGERDFRRANLRGQSFKGQDLSGADFSEADIRGTNFTNARLNGANFTKATAGVQKRWVLGQLCLSFLLSTLLNFVAVSINAVFFYSLLSPHGIKQYTIFPGLSVILIIAATFFAIARQGFTVRALTTIVLAVAVAVAVAVAGAGAVAVASLLLGIYCSRQARKGNAKFALLLSFGNAFSALGGTSFCGADLTSADLTQVMLNGTNFNPSKQQPTSLTHACWYGAKQLDRARLGDSLLSNAAVRDLLVTRNGYKKAYVDANLRGANLNGVNLNAANLKGADLSDAMVQQADLRDANLREVLAINTDFTGACFTGACLEAWNIDHTTILKDIDCQYVFLLEQPNALGSRERRPHEPDQVFAPGDFERLYTKMMNVVQVLLRNGMNRTAFAEAFQQLINENPDISYESIQAVERKGNDALVTLEVSATADKAEISRSLRESYESKVRQLEAKVETLHQLRAADLKEVALAQKAQFFNQLVGGNAMQESIDQSRHINVSGNVTGSTFNLGEISGNVTNTINQLQAANPQAAELVDRLRQLQHAIETDADLKPDDKTEALEQVGTLAKAGENPQDGTLKKLAGTAVKVLKGTIAALPSTATIVKACSDLLPAIVKLLGL